MAEKRASTAATRFEGGFAIEDELDLLVRQATQARAEMGDLRQQLRQMESHMHVLPRPTSLPQEPRQAESNAGLEEQCARGPHAELDTTAIKDTFRELFIGSPHSSESSTPRAAPSKAKRGKRRPSTAGTSRSLGGKGGMKAQASRGRGDHDDGNVLDEAEAPTRPQHATHFLHRLLDRWH